MWHLNKMLQELPPGWRSCAGSPSSDTTCASVNETTGEEIGAGPSAASRTLPPHLPPARGQVWVHEPSCKRRQSRLQGQLCECRHTQSSERGVTWRPGPAGSSGPRSHLIRPSCLPGSSQALEFRIKVSLLQRLIFRNNKSIMDKMWAFISIWLSGRINLKSNNPERSVLVSTNSSVKSLTLCMFIQLTCCSFSVWWRKNNVSN